MLNDRSLFTSSSPRVMLAIVAGLGFMLMSHVLFAQEEEPQTMDSTVPAENSDREATVPEVVVSASRIPVPAEHIGSSITVINQEEIEQRQPNFVHELLRTVPSVAVSQSGAGGGLTQVRIRGAEGNHTLVVIDGLDMGNPFSADEFHFQHLPVSTIQSIEVLRGPQSAIHGSESIGGVISITTPIPQKGAEASVSAELGSHKTRNARLYVSTADDHYYTSIAASHSATAGGASAKTDNDEKDGFVNQYLHLKSGIQVAENVDLSAVLIGINSEGEIDGFTPTTNSIIGKDQKRLIGITLQYNQDHDPVTHKFSISNSVHKRKDLNDGVQTSASRGESRKILYQGTLNYTAFDLPNSTTFAAEQKASKVKSGSLSHPVGGNFKLRSHVLEHRLNFDDVGFISISGRSDDSRNDVFASRNTYRISGAWILHDQLRLHSSYGTGVKNPTISEIFGWTTEWQPNPDLRPETSRGWDLGIEKEFNDGGFTVDVTYFNNKIDNLIDPYFCVSKCQNPPTLGGTDPDGANVYKARNLDGTSRIKGLELSARGELGDGYGISAHYTYSDGVAANNTRLVRRPTRTASINVNRDLPIFGYQGNVNLNVQHTGKQMDINNVTLRSFTLAHLNATIPITPKSQITAKIDNLFDNDDYAEVNNYGVTGRTLRVGVRYDF